MRVCGTVSEKSPLFPLGIAMGIGDGENSALIYCKKGQPVGETSGAIVPLYFIDGVQLLFSFSSFNQTN